MKILHKLLLVFTLLAMVLVLSMVAIIQWSLSRGMVEYVNQKELEALKPLQAELVSLYQKANNWQFIARDGRYFERLLRQSLMDTEFSIPHRPPRPPERGRFHERKKVKASNKDVEQQTPLYRPRRDRPPPRSRPTDQRDSPRQPKVSYALLDVNKQLVVGHYPPHRDYSYSSMTQGKEVIGYLAVSKRTKMLQGYELAFVEQQKHYLWYVAIIMLFVIVAITIPLAKHFIEPIKKLAIGMHALARGDYSKELSVERRDEFAQLARDYNELAIALAESEGARKRWLANTSHELRTPVAVLKGELEAIIDGVRALNMKQIESAHQEVVHLQRLIEDLHALTSADIGGMSYRKSPINMTMFLNEQVQKLRNYLSSEQITLTYQAFDETCAVYADEVRLSQLFENLANNTIKYAQGATKVNLSCQFDKANRQLCLCFEDDGEGVEEQHLPHLFEHLYRVETSRNRATGGSGLGLSICAHIVNAHQGAIYAHKSVFGGLAIHIELPTIKPNLLEVDNE